MGQMITTSERGRMLGKMGGRKLGAFGAVRKMEIAQRKVMEKMIYKKTAPLIRAGMISAMGQNFVYRIDEDRDSKGKLLSRKHTLVIDPKEIAKALDEMEEGGKHPDDKYYYITTKEPDVRAIEALLNRGYGRPKETLDLNVDAKFSLKELAKQRQSIKEDAIILPSEALLAPTIDVRGEEK